MKHRMTITVELDFEVEAVFDPGEPGCTTGPLDGSTPGYGPECQLKSVKLNDAKRKSGSSPNLVFWLSESEQKWIEEQIIKEILEDDYDRS